MARGPCSRNSGVSGPLRGEKSTTWEGGDRVPCIVSWPGKIDPAVSGQLMVNYDMYATFARLAGANVAKGQRSTRSILRITGLRGKRVGVPVMFTTFISQRPTGAGTTNCIATRARVHAIPTPALVSLPCFTKLDCCLTCRAMWVSSQILPRNIRSLLHDLKKSLRKHRPPSRIGNRFTEAT